MFAGRVAIFPRAARAIRNSTTGSRRYFYAAVVKHGGIVEHCNVARTIRRYHFQRRTRVASRDSREGKRGRWGK